MELITEHGQLDIYDDFRWSLNYKTAEVVNLTGRKASFSKTIVIPYTKNNRFILQGLDEWNVDNVGYNTKSSLGCFLTHNGRLQMRGRIIVLKYTKLKEEEQVQLQLISSVKTIVSALKKVKLNDLDFSRWNHEFNIYSIYNSAVYGLTALNGVQSVLGQGKGYVYPLADYGKDDLGSEIRWKATDLRPCLYLKEYIDTIFRFAGKTYTSDFFDSPYFRSIILENTQSKGATLSQEELDALESEVENTVGFKTYTDNGQGHPIPPNVFIPNADPPYPFGAQTYDQINPIVFTNEVTDPANQWDITGNGVFTADRTGTFQFKLSMQFYHEFTLDFMNDNYNDTLQTLGSQWLPTMTFDISPLVEEEHYIQMIKNGSQIIDEVGLSELPPSQLSTDLTPWYGTGSSSIEPIPGLLPYTWTNTGLRNRTFEFTLDLQEGDTIQFQTLDEAREDVAPPFPDLEAIIHRFNVLNASCEVNVTESLVSPGDLITFSNYIPNVNADKFIDTIFNTFNMWVVDDPFNENNIIAEPRTNIFDGNSYVDMSLKLDISKVIESDYLADKLPKVFSYRFKPSDDILNEIDNKDLEPYADFDSVVDIDYADSTKVIPIEFSPVITQEKNGLNYPLEYKDNGGLKENLGAFLKIGFTSRVDGDWELEGFDGTILPCPKYNRISEFDDLTNPNYSLTFGDANAKVPLNTVPYWNLYRLFHQLTEEEHTRDGSKVITAYFNLNENDIANLDLRVPWFVNGVYYRIVSVSDFNPTLNESTKVTLLQVESPKFDFTSNQMIYKMAELDTPVLSDNKQQIVNTQLKENVQPS